MTKTIDGTQLYQDAIHRIQQLEKLNELLAEQLDRQRLVIEAARELSKWENMRNTQLAKAVNAYDKQMAQLAKESE